MLRLGWPLRFEVGFTLDAKVSVSKVWIPVSGPAAAFGSALPSRVRGLREAIAEQNCCVPLFIRG